jgi:hypothetical protein
LLSACPAVPCPLSTLRDDVLSFLPFRCPPGFPPAPASGVFGGSSDRRTPHFADFPSREKAMSCHE